MTEIYRSEQFISEPEFIRDKIKSIPADRVELRKPYILRYKEAWVDELGYEQEAISDALVIPLAKANVGRVWGFKLFAPYLEDEDIRDDGTLRVFTNPDGLAFNPYSLPLSQSGELDYEDERAYFMELPEFTDADADAILDETTPNLGQLALGHFE
jgi:hypothetical protein